MKVYNERYSAEGIPKHEFNIEPLPGQYKVITENFTMEETYKLICNGHYYRDINQHAPTLRRFASKCKTTAEFGMAVGCSARAILSGLPQEFTTVEIVDSPNARNVVMNLGILCKKYNIKFTHIRENDIKVDLKNVDLLHLDSSHATNHVTTQLMQNRTKVNKYILGHDYNSSQVRDAFTNFLKAAPEWKIIEIHNYNFGLVVLEKDG